MLYQLLSADFVWPADYQKCLNLMRDREWHGSKHVLQRFRNLTLRENEVVKN